MTRRGFGDETWRLASTGDGPALERAAELLRDANGGVDYEGRRAVAFKLALDGRRDAALAELNEGWADDWPPPSAYALDVSRVQFLAGDCDRALAALQLEVHSVSEWGGVHEIVAGCVRKNP